jgi:glucose/arabinose dehydrogenase
MFCRYFVRVGGPSTIILAAVISAIAAAPARAQYFTPIPVNGAQITLQPVVSGLVSPLDIQSTPDNTGRLVLTDQAGKVSILQGGAVQSTVIDLSSRLTPFRTNSQGAITYDERGLLGFAYDPQFNNSASPGFHKVYSYTTEPRNATADFTVPVTTITMNHQNVVAQWTVNAANPDLVDTTTRRELLRIDEPYFNHDAGPIRFGPDGLLYIAQGDGGLSNDNGEGHTASIGNSQDATRALGKMLRIDVRGNNSANGQYGIPADNPFINAPAINGNAVVKEIYAYGLRNVYRFSFDDHPGGTGKLIAADVGQNNVEEIDNVTKGGNYGWHIKEGTLAFDPTTGNVSTNLTGVPTTVTDPNGATIPLTDPLAEYDHADGSAIVGGYVYRGSIMPNLVGKYIFADYGAGIGNPRGRIFYADLTTGQITQFTGGVLSAQSAVGAQYIKGMGQDANGELYVTTSPTIGPSGTAGAVYELVPEPTSLGLLATGAMLLLRRGRGDRRF